jgi:hypothetical protein
MNLVIVKAMRSCSRKVQTGGATFGRAINLSNETGNSTDPDIASAYDGRAVGVWTADTNGKKQVFFTTVT